MYQINPIINIDFYKSSHFSQYPKGISYVSSYIESRGGKYKKSVFFGLQFFLKSYLSSPITSSMIDEAEEFITEHKLPFNRKDWDYILEKYDGYLPIEIEAIEEGTILPNKNVMLQVVNTDPRCFWLTSYIETSLLRAIWYPTTICTHSWYCKKIISKYLKKTSDDISGLNNKLHDFGARGVSSAESSIIGGAAHLVHFEGSCNALSVLAIRKHYNEHLIANSIPSAEHSTITSWGKNNESLAYLSIFDHFIKSNKIVSIVSDSYDLWNAIDNIWGTELKENVKNSDGILVIRPDSGDPTVITTETIERLMAKFGYSVNKKGYKLLPPFIRVIQGGGISYNHLKNILFVMEARGQSTDNIVFGMGGKLLQRLNRDTMRFAMKASAVKINEEWQDIYKNPITDNNKISKKGRLALIKDEKNEFKTIQLSELKERENFLKPIFRNGKILREYSFSEIRERVNKYAQPNA